MFTHIAEMVNDIMLKWAFPVMIFLGLIVKNDCDIIVGQTIVNTFSNSVSLKSILV